MCCADPPQSERPAAVNALPRRCPVSPASSRRRWSLDWLTAHCQSRFGVTPTPRALADLWGFDAARLPEVTSRIIFTNGLVDGWSAGSITTNISDTILAYVAPNGAHHSDLGHDWPNPAVEAPDVTVMRALVHDKIAEWMADVQA